MKPQSNEYIGNDAEFIQKIVTPKVIIPDSFTARARKSGRLSNGAKVVVFEGPKGSPINIQIYFLSGARFDETPGLAHLYEHMALMHNRLLPKKSEALRIAKSNGWQMNAFTGQDTMSFYLSLQNKDRFMDAIRLISYSVKEPVFDKQNLEEEKKAIVREIDGSQADISGKHEAKTWMKHVYAGGVLARPVLGTKETLNTFLVTDLEKYHQTRLIANRMTVLISGNISYKYAKEVLETYLGQIPLVKSDISYVQSAAVYTDRVMTEKVDHLDGVQISYGFRVCPAMHKDFVTLNILRYIMGGSVATSRIGRRMRTDAKGKVLSYSTPTYFNCFLGAGSLRTVVNVPVAESTNTVQIFNELYEELMTGKRPVTREELDTAKNILLSNIGYSLEESEGWVDVNDWETYWPVEPENSEQWSPQHSGQKVLQVTLEDIHRVAAKYCPPNKSFILAFGKVVKKQFLSAVDT